MNVNLGPTFDKFIAEMLETGLYQSQSEVVRDGLRLLKEREEIRQARLADLRKEIAKGIKDLECGNFKTLDKDSLKEVFEDVKRRGRKILAERRSKAA